MTGFLKLVFALIPFRSFEISSPVSPADLDLLKLKAMARPIVRFKPAMVRIFWAVRWSSTKHARWVSAAASVAVAAVDAAAVAVAIAVAAAGTTVVAAAVAVDAADAIVTNC